MWDGSRGRRCFDRNDKERWISAGLMGEWHQLFTLSLIKYTQLRKNGAECEKIAYRYTSSYTNNNTSNTFRRRK